MKRYVKEFANDILRANNLRVRQGELMHPGIIGIEKVITLCEGGYITSKEAVKCILEIDEDCKGVSWEVK